MTSYRSSDEKVGYLWFLGGFYYIHLGKNTKVQTLVTSLVRVGGFNYHVDMKDHVNLFIPSLNYSTRIPVMPQPFMGGRSGILSVPINHSDSRQSWLFVISCMWKAENSMLNQLNPFFCYLLWMGMLRLMNFQSWNFSLGDRVYC